MYNVYQNTKDHLSVNYYLSAPSVKNVQKKTPIQIQDEIVTSVATSRNDLVNSITDDIVRTWVKEEEAKLRKKLANDEWIVDFRGKYIFNRLCGEVLKTDQIKIRQAYVDLALAEKPEVFFEVSDIFKGM